MSKLSVEYGGMVSQADGIPAHKLFASPGVYERADIEDHHETVIVDGYGTVISISKSNATGDVLINPEAPVYGRWKPAGFAITFRMLAP